MLLIPRYLSCSSGAASPLTLPGSAALESWHRSDQGLTIGPTLRRVGGGAPADVTISAGDREQSIGLVIKITGAGGLGVATYAAYSDGGVGAPFQTGLMEASVVLTSIGLTLAMPPGAFNTSHSYEGVVESWANLTPKVRTLSSVGAVSAQPRIVPAAKNNRPTIHSSGGSTGFLQDVSSSWAADVGSGTDSDFSVFLMCKTDTAAPGSVQAFMSFGNSVNVDSLWEIGIRNGLNNYRSSKVDDGGAAAFSEGGSLDTLYHVLYLCQHGTTIDMRDNGSLVYSGSAQNVGLTTLDNVALFARLRAGAASNALSGEIGEVITYNTALSASDALTIEDYLRNGWGL